MTICQADLFLTLKGSAFPSTRGTPLTPCATRQVLHQICQKHIPEILVYLKQSADDPYDTGEASVVPSEPIQIISPLTALADLTPADSAARVFFEPSILNAITHVTSQRLVVDLAYCQCGRCPGLSSLIALLFRALIMCLSLLALNRTSCVCLDFHCEAYIDALKTLKSVWQLEPQAERDSCLVALVDDLTCVCEHLGADDPKALLLLQTLCRHSLKLEANDMEDTSSPLPDILARSPADISKSGGDVYILEAQTASFAEEGLKNDATQSQWLTDLWEYVRQCLQNLGPSPSDVELYSVIHRVCATAGILTPLHDVLLIKCISCTSRYCLKVQVAETSNFPLRVLMRPSCREFDVGVTTATKEIYPSLIDSVVCPAVSISILDLKHFDLRAVHCFIMLIRLLGLALPFAQPQESSSAFTNETGKGEPPTSFLLTLLCCLRDLCAAECLKASDLIRRSYAMGVSANDLTVLRHIRPTLEVAEINRPLSVTSLPLLPVLLDSQWADELPEFCKQFKFRSRTGLIHDVQWLKAAIERASLESVQHAASHRHLKQMKMRLSPGDFVSLFTILGVLHTSPMPTARYDADICCRVILFCAKMGLAALFQGDSEAVTLMVPKQLDFATLLDTLNPFLRYCREKLLTNDKVMRLSLPEKGSLFHEDMPSLRLLIIFVMHLDAVKFSLWLDQKMWKPSCKLTKQHQLDIESKLTLLHRFSEKLRGVKVVNTVVLTCVQYLVRYIEIAKERETVDSSLLLLHLLCEWADSDKHLVEDPLWSDLLHSLLKTVSKEGSLTAVEKAFALMIGKQHVETQERHTVMNAMGATFDTIYSCLVSSGLSRGKMFGLLLCTRLLDYQITHDIRADAKTRSALQKLKPICVQVVADCGLTGPRRVMSTGGLAKIATDCLVKCSLVLQTFAIKPHTADLSKPSWWNTPMQTHVIKAIETSLLPIRLDVAGIAAITLLHQHFSGINTQLRDFLSNYVWEVSPYFEKESIFAVSGPGPAYKQLDNVVNRVIAFCEPTTAALIGNVGWVLLCTFPSIAIQMLAPIIGSFILSVSTTKELAVSVGEQLRALLTYELSEQDMLSLTKKEATLTLKLIILETIDKLEDWLEELQSDISESVVAGVEKHQDAVQQREKLEKVQALLHTIPFRLILKTCLACSNEARALMTLERRLLRTLTVMPNVCPPTHLVEEVVESVDQFRAGLARQQFYSNLATGVFEAEPFCLAWCPLWSVHSLLAPRGVEEVLRCIRETNLEPDNSSYLQGSPLVEWTGQLSQAAHGEDDPYTVWQQTKDLYLSSRPPSPEWQEKLEIRTSPWLNVRTPEKPKVGDDIWEPTRPLSQTVQTDFLECLKKRDLPQCRELAKAEVYSLQLSAGAAAWDSSLVLERLLEGAMFWSSLQGFTESVALPAGITQDVHFLKQLKLLNSFRSLSEESDRLKFLLQVCEMSGCVITHSWLLFHMLRAPEVFQIENKQLKKKVLSRYHLLKSLGNLQSLPHDIQAAVNLVAGGLTAVGGLPPLDYHKLRRLKIPTSERALGSSILRLTPPQLELSEERLVTETVNILELEVHEHLIRMDKTSRLMASVALAPNFGMLRWSVANAFHEQWKWWTSDERILQLACAESRVSASTTLTGKQAIALLNRPTPSSRDSLSIKGLALSACVEYLAAATLLRSKAVVCLLRCLQIMMEMCSPVTSAGGSTLKQSVFCEAAQIDFCNEIMKQLVPDLSKIPVKYWFTIISHLISRSAHPVLGQPFFIPILAWLLLRMPKQSNWYFQPLLNSNRATYKDVGIAIVDKAISLLSRITKTNDKVPPPRARRRSGSNVGHNSALSDMIVGKLSRRESLPTVQMLNVMVDKLSMIVKCLHRAALNIDPTHRQIPNPTLSRLYPQLQKSSAELMGMHDEMRFVVPIRDQLECKLETSDSLSSKRNALSSGSSLYVSDVLQTPSWMIPPLNTCCEPEPDDDPFPPGTNIDVIGIEDNIEILMSKQQPKKIILQGSDGACYPFLLKNEVKGDLRKDSRVQDFVSVAGAWTADVLETSVSSFSVVPLTEVTGLIEWLSNLQTLRKTVTKTHRAVLNVSLSTWMRELQESFKAAMGKPAELYQIFVGKACKLPPGLHKHFLNTFGRQPSAWLRARQTFVKTCAFWSIVGFLTGLGDRHGDNILISDITGECVHVDFDCLFGKGFYLQVPEIVPFRLTQNLVIAMGALGVEGTFTATCIRVWNQLRARSDDCMALMSAFVHDPLVEWGDRKPNSSVASCQNAKQTLEEMQWKLEGNINFSAPFTTELMSRVSGEVDPITLIKQLTLFPQPQWLNRNLSTEEQVKLLIISATCPLNLALMYVGWTAWV
eukprot:Blabericola_migrator_1__4152@NODE_226_length_11123_cov_75_892547_g192_i0_p1_GENE_NODE_226_length_11123_cov_75_892547_g192_i0NODE_226_length_11123_cov_75_892547_g192_i0_p1_ORF_typecomplete_len2337_score308_41PI3_PI4_kinase/PF00454_27/3_9e47FATC/PF02260_20/5_5e10UBN_AB/PF14075_6/0_28UBN_AB/PF14075_6/99Herpes_U44/PF04533_13/53Herpes_U44/PF04533_13/3_9_NODE_226_length_11123_cov_75_892547_g192_i0307910089